METKRHRTRRSYVRALLAAAALTAITAAPSSDSNAQAGPSYNIDFHYIAAGGQRSNNSCFVIRGTVGQTAPGYSFGGIYGLSGGFWTAAPLTGQDQLFFNGFERC